MKVRVVSATVGSNHALAPAVSGPLPTRVEVSEFQVGSSVPSFPGGPQDGFGDRPAAQELKVL